MLYDAINCLPLPVCQSRDALFYPAEACDFAKIGAFDSSPYFRFSSSAFIVLLGLALS